MKIVRFLFGTLSLISSFFLSYFTYTITESFETSGLASLSLIVTIPIFIVFSILLAGVLINSIFKFIGCITSDSKLIKVLSIIFLILTTVLAIIDIYFVVGIIKQLKQ